MNRTLSSLVLLYCLCFTACKKEGGEPSENYAIVATIDGNVKSYTYTPTAVMLDAFDAYSVGMAAYTDASVNDIFTLNILKQSELGAIVPGTYVDDYTNEDVFVLGGFNLGSMDDAEAYGAGLQEGTDPKLTITITELTDKIIRGTFSGTFFDHGGDGPGKVSVTDGKFYLPVVK
ncbi:hypothetical protein I5907_09795 [Panacibacter sp. DH6]|uniref:Uncharacterized protein n=1 Tax=Panacibacter microcysteis TaxID=2793269 RepID=A0A931GUC6_9BACT|nr:hypothetical protein [Panacibacter microcysteis]MBG9376526.1 hypothetical protein [Panacibacter microcysteis]